MIDLDGADNRSRTYDLRITNALLYQLSYAGNRKNVLYRDLKIRQIVVCLALRQMIRRFSSDLTERF